MSNEVVTYKISPDGQEVTIDAEGFVGSKCKDFSKDVIKSLGHVQSEKKKPEFHSNQGGGVKVGA